MTTKKIADIKEEYSPPMLPIEWAIVIGGAIVLIGTLILFLFG